MDKVPDQGGLRSLNSQHVALSAVYLSLSESHAVVVARASELEAELASSNARRLALLEEEKTLTGKIEAGEVELSERLKQVWWGQRRR